MDIWETSKLVLFIAFVVPGFVSLKVYELLLPRAPRDASQQVVDAVAYSSINYALLIGPIYLVETSKVEQSHPMLYTLFYVFVMLLAPVLWACVLRFLRSTDVLQFFFPHPTAKPWDYVFSQRRRYWVLVTLKDGKQVAGRYDTKSFASSAPSPEQLYLEQAWVLNSDGGFERPRADSEGILVLTPEIATVELFKVTHGGEHVSAEIPNSVGATDQGLSTVTSEGVNR